MSGFVSLLGCWRIADGNSGTTPNAVAGLEKRTLLRPPHLKIITDFPHEKLVDLAVARDGG